MLTFLGDVLHHHWRTGPYGTISVSVAPVRLAATLSASTHHQNRQIAVDPFSPRTFLIHLAHEAGS